MQKVNLGMIGGGTVGSGVFHAWQLNGRLMADRLGVALDFRRIAVKDLDEPRPYPIPRSLMTTNWQEVVNDPQVQVVIELVGGTGIAKTMILSALAKGKTVVTANKALLSAHGPELFAAAAKAGVNLYYEASVCGGIPIIKSLREGFVANRFPAIYGIVNGTCNYILTRMRQEGADFADVLADAQKQGYAETPPDLDIDGFDAQHKIGILASLAHGFWVDHRDIHTEGIREVSRIDMQFARQLGYAIKLLGIAKRVDGASDSKRGAPTVQVSVYPALIPASHVLASVDHVFNAVFVRGDVVGDTLFYGRGAGKDATASAVLSDVADAALDLKNGTPVRVPPFVSHAKKGRVLPIDRIVSRYYVRLSVVDRPGVLARISAIFAANRIGISSVLQPEGHEGESVPLILMLHDAPNGAMRQALAAIARLPVVKAKPVLFRVETLD
ncbi:MAG TPA: homoserine dehydrogenase [Verrucomicrobia bacterium]|nr:homoserine dehydrogenase [Verrucomicrobiota bacterium]HOP98428.1 homoserine dehydrogenase [Verrucomicrobiota bacterium]HPU55712.1 homoserine dehydrogenase [Verrucomicrobiota bacterium]